MGWYMEMDVYKMIDSPFECPQCGMLYVGIITKYLPPKHVPGYAEFQPMQKLSYCRKCEYCGIHKVEMFVKNSPLNIPKHEMWTEQELKDYGIERKQNV